MTTRKSVLVWFRRDLRLSDHAALSEALADAEQVFCVFVFDRAILQPLIELGLTEDRRVEFILESVTALDAAIKAHGGALIVLHADSVEAVPALAQRLGVDAVYANRDYEPAAALRDGSVAGALEQQGRTLALFKDQVIFERDEIMTQAGHFFSVFTPYRRAWSNAVNAGALKPHPVSDRSLSRLAKPAGAVVALPSLGSLGFKATNLTQLGIHGGSEAAEHLFEDFVQRMDRYRDRRDFPAMKGPSYLSVHLRFGTISIRTLARRAFERQAHADDAGAQTWLSELIWRDFYMQILYHRPDVVEHAFKPEYDRIQWETGALADKNFAAWCDGRTGYPLVDAAMCQINQTGYMHNRLRMVVASFLTKDLGIDWRRGEQYFAQRLIDFDLSANNGGWQWAASTGCDAQPYFRIFNPITQSEKFDADGKFILRYLPQLKSVPIKHIHAPWRMDTSSQTQAGLAIGKDYPEPIVAHDLARERTLERYAVIKSARTESAS